MRAPIAPHAKPGAGEVKAMSAGEAAALAAVYGPLVPLSHEERVAKACAIAKVRAEDERRRAPSPQMDLAA